MQKPLWNHSFPTGWLVKPVPGHTCLGETTSCSSEDSYGMVQKMIPIVSNLVHAVITITAWGFSNKTVWAWKKSACQKPSYLLKHKHHFKQEWHYRDLSFALAWLMNTPVTWTPISDPNSQIFSCSSEVLLWLAARSSLIGGRNELSPSSSIAGRRFLPQGARCCPAARGSLLPTSASWANCVPGSLKTNCCSKSVLIFHQS